MSFHFFFAKIYENAAQRMCLECTEFIKKGDKILDFGCGSGIVSKNFQDFFKADILGVDIKDSRVVSIPFKKIKEVSSEKLPFNDLSFDVALVSYVLHHTKDPGEILKELKRVAKRIIVYEDLPEGFLSKLRCFFHEISYKILFQRVKYRFNFKTEKKWKELFEKLGLKIVAQKKASGRFNFIDPTSKIIFILDGV